MHRNTSLNVVVFCSFSLDFVELFAPEYLHRKMATYEHFLKGISLFVVFYRFHYHSNLTTNFLLLTHADLKGEKVKK